VEGIGQSRSKSFNKAVLRGTKAGLQDTIYVPVHPAATEVDSVPQGVVYFL
jgi:hypothetical protein